MKEEKRDDSPKKRRRRPTTTEPDEKDENREVVNVKTKDSDPDAMDEDDQDEKATHSEAEGEEPQVASKQEEAKEKTKGVVLKSAADPAVKEKADALLGEKAPHPPVGRTASEEASREKAVDDPYAKAPHGDSSTDEEGLEAELRSLGGLPQHHRSSEVRSGRSDRAAYDEEERRSVPSSSLAKKDKKKKRKTEKAMDSRSVLSEEPAKRKKKSKHGSKKAAKKGHRQPSHPPSVGEYELDMEGVPRDRLEQTVHALHRVNQGLKSSSDRAESALSGMPRMIGRMTRARNDERNWLQEENRLLNDLVGWKRVGPRVATPPPSSSEDETESLDDDEQEEDAAVIEEAGDA